MKQMYFIILLLFSFCCMGQDISLKKAMKYIAKADSCEMTYIGPNDVLFGMFKDKDTGYVAVKNRNIYRLLKREDITMYDYGIINIDGTNLTIDKINALRDEIMAEYRNGVVFSELIQKYSRDKDSAAASIFVGHKRLWQPFAEVMALHKKGDIFVFDDPEEKLYKVVVLNEEPYIESVAVVLKYVYQ